MKKLFCILVVGISLAGCMREISDAGPESGANVAKEVSGTAVSVEDALAEMYYVMGELYGTTRSVSVAAGDVLTVTGDQIRRATRSSEDTELPENVLYLVNFGDGEGYAVLGADERFPSVIAVVEQGSISPADFDFSDYEGAYSLGEDGIVSLDDLWCEEDEDYYLGALDPNKLILDLVRTPPIIDDPGPFVYEHGPWSEIISYRGAMMDTRWHQHPPFNDKCPTGSRARESNGRYPAGCVAIAVAQILARNGTPTAESLFGVTSTWADFVGYNFNTRLNANSTALDTLLRDEIATVLRRIGDGCDTKYGFWGNKSFSTPYRAKKYLRDKVGYKNVEKHESYKEDAIISCLRKGHPVFMGAIDNVAKGHAWVIDGYMHQSRQSTQRSISTGNVIAYTETRKLMHCNFGWEGTANGFYISKAFDTKKGPVIRDPNIDTEGDVTSSNKWDSDYWWRTVVYDL